ncbi:MAG: hypothetical protein P1V97_15960 [Planctomycetota bacterium]|nr:hypothetical protein [Planctomycetota bacterium]
MAKSGQEQTVAHVSDSFQTLVNLGYLKDNSVMICPRSHDMAIPAGSETIPDPKTWTWGGIRLNTPCLPVKKSSKLSVYMNPELSYTLRRHELKDKDGRSDAELMVDKWLRPTGRDGGALPGAKLGNHHQGLVLGYADGHVEFTKKDDISGLKRIFKVMRMRID